ncbi:MAG: hypothetical protein LBQ83_04760 [Candidatus Margulisbacteria bacterium]|jgi:hypothetical protein|nr:hypothetical protein [Candidatus Margulisiibacteriota bacterium]
MRSVKWLVFLLLLGQSAANITADAFEPIPTLTAKDISGNTFSVEADYINYLGENHYVKTSGNVVVINGDVRLRANSATVNFHSQQLLITDGFVFNRSQQQIYGTELDYDYSRREAQGSNVGLTLMGNRIKGRTMLVREDVIVIEDASQTTCPDEHNPCNHITSRRMTIYPEWGNVVNDHAVIYFFFLPVMYVPNSVSDLNGGREEMYSSIPRLGYNPVEGNYIKAGWSFYQNEKLNGTLDLHYLSNLGLRYGFTDNYKLDQSNRGQLRLHYLTGLGGRTSYGWQHRLLLGVPRRDRGQIIDDFFRGILPPSKDHYPEIVLDLVNREMVGYQWLSYRPKITLALPRYELLDTGLLYTLSGYAANILEEDVEVVSRIGDVQFEGGNRAYLQRNFEGNVYRDFGLGSWGSLTPGALYSSSTYFDGTYLSGLWTRLIYYADYTKNWSRLNFTAGYKYTPSERGFSPFNAETFYAGTSEENNFSVGVRVLDNLKLKYTQYYSITNHKVRDRVYGGEFKLHCWNASVNWSEYYSQFTFGISM